MGSKKKSLIELDDFTEQSFDNEITLDSSLTSTKKDITTPEYNKMVYDEAVSGVHTLNPSDYIKDKEFHIVHPELMVRLFKTEKVSHGGIHIPNVKLVPSESGERMVAKLDDSELSDFQSRGVVVKVSDSCSDKVKGTIEVGDIVDVRPVRNLAEYRYHFDIHLQAKFENYFLFPEGYIRMVWKNKAK